MRGFRFEDASGAGARAEQKMLSHPDLDDASVALLAARYQQHGDIAARDVIVLHFQRLVRKAAEPYIRRSSGNAEDLISSGRLGLFRAIEDFDPSINPRFATHAWNWVLASIREEMYRNWDTVRPYRGTIFKHRRAGASTAYVASIDAMTNTDGNELDDPLAVLGFRTEAQVPDTLPSLDSVLERYQDVLDDRERHILRERAKKVPLVKLAESLRLSIARVQQIEVRAVEKLRRAVAG